jgi:glycerophosphoryl diester phosphodiesterase
MPADQRATLARWVKRAHAQGRLVRFWNTPDREDAWKLLLEAGVDLLGTDDLDGLRGFLGARTNQLQ